MKTSPRANLALAGLLLFALLMGPGPGLALVNPAADDPNARRTFLGMPVVYAWGVLWFAVEAIVLALAYRIVRLGEKEEE